MSNKPKGYTTITPVLTVKNAKESIELYQKAFGVELLYKMDDPQNPDKIMHAGLQFGDSKVFISDEYPEVGAVAPSYQAFYIYVDDVDAAFKQAIDAGLTVKKEVEDMFWGDRVGAVTDINGYSWSLATFVKEMSDDEMMEGASTYSSD